MSRVRQATAAVHLEGVVKRFGDRPAVAPLDLRVGAGESVAVLGHNGSGKSTLLALVAGVLEPSEGVVRVFGREPSSIEARALCSYLADTPVLYDDLSVREHLQYVSRLHGGSGTEPLLDELIERLGLGPRADELPAGFSRGQRQKVAIAVALCRPLRLLLVDEPFVGLDTAGREAFTALVAERLAEGASVVVATHEPGLLPPVGRWLVLVDGAVDSDGPPAAATGG